MSSRSPSPDPGPKVESRPAIIKHLRAEHDGHCPAPKNDTGQPPPQQVLPSEEIVVHDVGKWSTGFTFVVPVKIIGLEVSVVVDIAAEATILSRVVYDQLKMQCALRDEVVLKGLVRSS